jgi:hypothetical protein
LFDSQPVLSQERDSIWSGSHPQIKHGVQKPLWYEWFIDAPRYALQVHKKMRSNTESWEEFLMATSMYRMQECWCITWILHPPKLSPKTEGGNFIKGIMLQHCVFRVFLILWEFFAWESNGTLDFSLWC